MTSRMSAPMRDNLPKPSDLGGGEHASRKDEYVTPSDAETADQREQKAISLAEARGRRQQVVDGRLDEHDRRFARINGSIERSARAQETTNRELGEVKKGLEDVVSKLEVGEAVSAALAKAAVSRREFWLGVATVVAALAGALLGGGHV
jgi:hypothetical protein